jgi:hypothetical protein
MNGVHLDGLEGTNPLGFLAALGVQVVFASQPEQPRLWWSDDVTPHAVVDEAFTTDRIANRALAVFAKWAESPALKPRQPDGSVLPKGDELKLPADDIRTYLSQARGYGASGSLITALVAEGSLDRQGVAKPSDLYFTSGQQKFLAMARQILDGTSREDMIAGLEGQHSYESSLPSLMWDVSDDRVYALAADDPSNKDKMTNPGPEALAILGLSVHPVFAGRDRTLTQGCSGSWKAGHYSWPLWCKPARPFAVKSLLAHAYHHPAATDRHQWFRAWGVFRILQSPIRRSDQGGYGTFGPPEDALRSVGWKRVIELMDRVGAEARANGLIDAKLEALLADES